MKSFIFIFCLGFLNFKIHSLENELNTLTLEEKIAQLFIIGIDNNDYLETSSIPNSSENQKKLNRQKDEELIKKYKIGGVHFNKYGTLQSCFDAINHLQSISNIPLIVTQDFEWGLQMRLLDGIKFPYNMTLGAIQDNNLIYELGLEIGRQCKLLGTHINLAPVVDINNNPGNPVISFRSFGQDPQNVAQKAIAISKGLHDAKVIACAKHFCGHGDTSVDSHFDLPVINKSLNDLNNLELYPFKEIIDSGIKAIMPGHIQVPIIDSRQNRPISLSYNGISNLLKNELNFNGLIITDSLDMKAVTKNFKAGQIELEAFIAGNDMLLMSEDVPKAIGIIKEAIVKGSIKEEELDRRVLKILKVKQELNIRREKKNFSKNEFHTQYAYDLKKRLFEAAITIVSNKTVPLKAQDQNVALVLIAQEDTTKISEFYDQLKKYNIKLNRFFINKNDTQQKFDETLAALNRYVTIIIGLYDLNKFSETNYGVTENSINFINKLNNQKNIILNIFGNPYSLKYFKNIDNLTMAYEDEKEAQYACADIIFGNLIAKGELPITLN